MTPKKSAMVKIDINEGPIDMHDSREQEQLERTAGTRELQGGLVPMQRMLTLEDAAERHRGDSNRSMGSRGHDNDSNDDGERDAGDG